jgi:hypothetical protein
MKRLEHAYQSMTYGLVDLAWSGNRHDICDTCDGQGQIIGGGLYRHETVLVRNAQSARTVDLEKAPVKSSAGWQDIQIEN